jgi:hypothetical protein
MADLSFSNAVLPCTIGNTDGKTVVMKTGTLVTTAVTADQVILTYTVTAGKTFFVEYVIFDATTTVFSNNVLLGTESFESPAGTKLITDRFTALSNSPSSMHFAEPIPFSSGTVVRVVCTPVSTTSMTWIANFGGYER